MVLDNLQKDSHFVEWMTEQGCDFDLMDEGSVGWMLKFYAMAHPLKPHDPEDMAYLLVCGKVCFERLRKNRK